MLNKIKIFSSFGLSIDFEHEKEIELYVDVVPNSPGKDGVIRFVLLIEPPEIIDLTNFAIEKFGVTYKYLLTHNSEILNNLDSENVYLFEYGTTWINNYSFPNKDFSITSLVGGKNIAPGHKLRRELWSSQSQIINPTNFFMSGNFKGDLQSHNNNPTLGNKKEPLFSSQFHVCIENTKRDNLFTEKLMDCLQTKTIPIYWGCPNIEKWFDTRGFIIVNNIDDIIAACNYLDEETYNKMICYAEINFELSKKYIKLNNRIKSKIIQIINS